MPEAEGAGLSRRPRVREAGTAGPRLAYLVGRLDRVLRRELDQALRPYGLTTPQYTTLSVLRARDGLSNAQLARRSLMTPQSMSEVLAALAGKGFVRREASPAHGRVLRTRLTPAGSAVLTTCDRVVDTIEARMLEELGPRDVEVLRVALARCVRALGAGLADA